MNAVLRRTSLRIASAFFVAFIAAGAAAREAEDAGAALLARLLTGQAGEMAVSPSLEAAGGAAVLRSGAADLSKKHGAVIAIVPAGLGYLIEFADVFVPADLSFDAEGRVASLLFRVAQAKAANLRAAVDGFLALEGRTAVLVREGGRDLVAARADERMAVGSAFKLAVLKAVADRIAQGDLRWRQTVLLSDRHRSLPTGGLRLWAAGSSFTVEALAGHMIAESDNTATDALMGLVGRAAVEAAAPHMKPFPTTREVFVLKSFRHRDLRQRYIAGSEVERRAVLAEAGNRALPPASEVARAQTDEVEWFFSARELCALLEATAALPAIAINPGLAVPAHWSKIAFKGGGDAGVLNLTHRLEAKDGRVLCVATTWNATDPLDRDKFFARVREILAALRTPN
jgi:beta-lactamase class A